MPSADQRLPEGTDSIIEGAGVSEDDEFDATDESEAAVLASGFVPEGAAKAADNARPDSIASAGDLKAALFGRIDDVRGQAGDKARDLVQAGKDRATSALDELVRTIEEAAGQVDDTVGAQYGDYARRAAEGIGSFSEAVKDKDIDEIFDQARELIKKSPGIAIGAAAVLGFVVARLVRAGMPEAGVGKDGSA